MARYSIHFLISYERRSGRDEIRIPLSGMEVRVSGVQRILHWEEALACSCFIMYSLQYGN